MKNIFFAFIVLLITSCSTKQSSFFGEQIEDQVTDTYTSVYESAQNGTVENVVLEGEITQTCSKKGCWMDVKMAEGDTIKVSFKDYGFFVPKEGVEGLRTVIRGNARMDTTEPRFVLEFIADGVLIEQ